MACFAPPGHQYLKVIMDHSIFGYVGGIFPFSILELAILALAAAIAVAFYWRRARAEKAIGANAFSDEGRSYPIVVPQNACKAPKHHFSLRHMMLAIACFSITVAAWSEAWRIGSFGQNAAHLAALGLAGLAALGTGLGFLFGNAAKGFFAVMLVAVPMVFIANPPLTIAAILAYLFFYLILRIE